MIELIDMLQKVQFLMRQADSNLQLSSNIEVEAIQNELKKIHEIANKIEKDLNAKNN